MTERTRNAQAQARHREKRKQYIDNVWLSLFISSFFFSLR